MFLLLLGFSNVDGPPISTPVPRVPFSNFLAVCLTERSSAARCECKQKPWRIVAFTIDCPLTQFHAHLRGDEPHTFNSYKQQMAAPPFPARVKLLKGQFQKKQFQVNCLCLEMGDTWLQREGGSLLAQRRSAPFWAKYYICLFLCPFVSTHC